MQAGIQVFCRDLEARRGQVVGKLFRLRPALQTSLVLGPLLLGLITSSGFTPAPARIVWTVPKHASKLVRLKSDLPRSTTMLMKNILLLALFACSLASTEVRAETLPLPANLIGAASDAGESLLVEADAREAYFPLAINFVTQKNQAFCGVASSVMVLNAIGVPAPTVPEYDPYTTFTQDNLLDARSEQVIPVETIKKQGMTLDELGGLLALQPLQIEIRHAEDSNLEKFRKEARDYLASEGRFVIVNYLRKAMGQEKGGHISPLAAYDVESDRFLILDVARYKYPPVWVTAADLFNAMNTQDSDNNNRTRGYVLIAARP
ncbi:phytochelatin synthase family protein [Mesorhizobium sp. LHD-90]|uniref:phytochelatin synthase family protein n=1 Tax=Mesorhizobium sp. LHD-90 TaxID=3071414 RepID=UPI0027E1B2B1|nr:phytochelatin synthase family protein [Mesorhizobium sp. LHD-90]MDQ6434467.1 phytochelatin synthase family protein [Mesorhizobium sp. LHD-90]